MNTRRLFVASCLALVATSMAFSIRADIIPALIKDFNFTEQEMGIVAGPGLWGFAITIVLGGMIVDAVGMHRVLAFAFFGHVLGTLMTIFSTGFYSLYFATLLIGLANGAVEAVINPLAATLYPQSKTKALNMLHAWWPGGLILGGLAGFGITKLMGLDLTTASLATISLGWKVKMGLILLPTLGYGYLMLGQKFPATERVTSGVTTREMWGEAVRPLFLCFAVLMMMTSATELGPDQWVGNLLQNLVGIQGVLFLVYTAGIMFVLRQFFAGAILNRVSPLGVLVMASALSAIGLFLLSGATTGAMVFLAATIFGFGKTFFWPTMIGVVAERFPKGGALLLGLLGGAGMFCVGWLMTPVMGAIQDHYAVESLSVETRAIVATEDGKAIDRRKADQAKVLDPKVAAELAVAQQQSAVMTYRVVAFLPVILTFIFLGLMAYFKGLGGYRAVSIKGTGNLSPAH